MKTLHPAVHAGILADRRKPEHVAQLEELGIAPFDLVVVNLYPFTETVASGREPRRVRRADRHRRPGDGAGRGEEPPVGRRRRRPRRGTATSWPPSPTGGFTLAERQRLAAAAFRHTASYDIAVASWMGSVLAPDDDSGFPAWVGASWERADVLRYGENPHQERRAVPRLRSPGSRTPSSCTARRCPTTTTSTPTPPGGPRTTTPTPASRSSSTPTRAGSPSAPTSPTRTARRTPATRSRRSAA